MNKKDHENTVGKHPIPHAKGMGKDETSDIEKQKKDNKSNNEEE